MGLLTKSIYRLLFWSTLPVVPLAAQISPGELSTAHEALEGMDNCTACHDRGSEIGIGKCLDCHENIQAVITAKHGMHFRFAGRACNQCHKEHIGRAAAITKFNAATFNHAETGFTLRGKHQNVACEKCHRVTSFRSERKAVSETAAEKTFLGLRGECVTCHADRHQATLGTKCERCHNVEGWISARTFDHATTKFALTGTHAQVSCRSCHESLAATPRPTPLLFTTKTFIDCTPCHRSPHREGFTAKKCGDCHSTSGWKSTERFDHSVTRFPLVGRHTTVACERCHVSMQKKRAGTAADLSTKPFSDCLPCHATPHGRELSARSCRGCHVPTGWGAVEAKEFDHGITGFPLRGKHRALECRKCHDGQSGTSLSTRYHSGAQRCATCHKDHHRGAFGARYDDCASCHQETGFSPSTFTITVHAQSRFPLTGAHAAIPCVECHRRSGATSVFIVPDLRCVSCHRDQHAGAFNALMGNNGCSLCHGMENWKRVRFDHRAVGFSLAGRHASVPCSGCHAPAGRAARYRGTTKDCVGCHADPHADQFSGNGRSSCASCHSPEDWKQLIFNHETQSRFQLTGAHKSVPCGACHPREQRNGRSVVRFKPLPMSCEACHVGGN